MTPGKPEAILSFANTLLYGVYLTSLGHCLRWLLFEAEGGALRPKIAWPTLAVTVLLFVLSTVNASIVFWMVMVAIDGQGSSAYDATWAWSSGLGITVLLIVDAVLIFRCWLVYLKSWLAILFPLVLWLANFVSGVIGLVFLVPNSLTRTLDNSAVDQGLFKSNMAFFVCEIAINVYVTSAIALQILRVTKWNGHQRLGRLSDIGRILTESGILFTFTCIVNMLFKGLALNIPSFQLTSSIMGSININVAVIAFNLVLIRVAQEPSHHGISDSEESTKGPTLSTFPPTYNSSQDESTIPDIEMQLVSRVDKDEDSKSDMF